MDDTFEVSDSFSGVAGGGRIQKYYVFAPCLTASPSNVACLAYAVDHTGAIPAIYVVP